MKIDDLLLLPQQPLRPEARPSGEANFAQYLNEALASQTKSTASQNTTGLGPVVGASPLTGSSQAPAEMVDAVLSRLELLQEALGRPEMSLKSLSPLIQALEADSRRLQALSQGLPPESPLRQVMQETAALSWVECFKFHRGDYL